MRFTSNDRWHGRFTPPEPGRYLFAIEAWTDQFAHLAAKRLLLKRDAGQDIALEAQEGRELLGELKLAMPIDKRAHRPRQARVRPQRATSRSCSSDELAEAVAASDPRGDLTRSVAIPVVADRPRARAGAWYEMLPRSQGTVPGRHGTFDDCIARLPDIAALGFDVLYLTPIHPIGRTNRKGRNNALKAAPDDPGSPYAIGSGRAATTRCIPSSARSTTSAASSRPAASTEHGGRARLRDAMLARSSVAQAASGMVQAAARRHDPLRREPAEEIPGHRQSGFLLRRPHRAVGGAARRRAVLGRAGRADLPRRQSAHQAVPVLGMADPRGAGRAIPT